MDAGERASNLSIERMDAYKVDTKVAPMVTLMVDVTVAIWVGKKVATTAAIWVGKKVATTAAAMRAEDVTAASRQVSGSTPEPKMHVT